MRLPRRKPRNVAKSYGLQLGYVENTASKLAVQPSLGPCLPFSFREFSDTQKVIPRLLSDDIATLPPEIVAVYVQNAAKIFASWAARLANNWDADSLPELKSKVELILEGLRRFAGHANFEVQERV